MKEQFALPPEEGTRPSPARVASGLTELRIAAGQRVEERFAPKPSRFSPGSPLVDYEYATKTLVVHPWTPPKARAEALLHHAAKTLAERPGRKRGKKAAAEVRDWAVEGAAAAALGLTLPAHARPDTELTADEQGLVARIVASVPPEGS